MILTLEATGPQQAAAGRHVFSTAGGIIGRAKSSDWVLSHPKVSGRHAIVSFLDGVFYIEDTSTNGVFINSPSNRLVAGRRYALKAGDRILIDPYEIAVSVSEPQRDRAPVAFDLDDAFGPPPAPEPAPRATPARQDLAPDPVSSEEVDPLKLLGADAKRAPAPVRQAPSAADLEQRSVMSGHFQPPAIVAPPPAPSAPKQPEAFVIPADYDPLRDDFAEPEAPAPPPAAVAWGPPLSFEAPVPVDRTRAMPPQAPPPVPREPPASPEAPAAVPVPEEGTPRAETLPPAGVPSLPEAMSLVEPHPVVEAVPAADAASRAEGPPRVEAAAREERPRREDVSPAAVPDHGSALAELLAAAGLENVEPSPELARTFGTVFRIVVSGVMDVLQSRQEVKDEFRMRVTQFRPVDNNPLKFSANVDDALHNLLIKRNRAYLGPAEAFEDAFEDLRHHQLAVLSGMRVAFESLLREFDPDRLQEQFDRQLKRVPVLRAMAKMQYWDLYKEWRDEMAKDPDASFKKLFGDQFAKAFEEQLNRLKAESRARAAAEKAGGAPGSGRG